MSTKQNPIYESPTYLKARREREEEQARQEAQEKAYAEERKESQRKHLERVQRERDERAAMLKAQDEQARRDFELTLKKQVKAAWNGTDEAFEQAWESSLRDKAIEEAVQRQRDAISAKYAGYF